MESAGEAAMIGFTMEALARAFGSGVRRRFLRGSTTHWTSDSFIGGAHTAARPGCANLRRQFLEPLHDRVFVAGEHASLDATTTHGAYLSGIRAAAQAAHKSGSLEIVQPDVLATW
jgi:monoamine oxidase